MASNRNRLGLWPLLTLTAVAVLAPGRLPAEDAASAGIFVEDAEGKAETKIESTMMADYAAQGVAASVFTGGLAKPKVVWRFGGARAEQRLPAQPVFRFRFDPKGGMNAMNSQDPAAIMAMVMGGGMALPPSAKGPEDFLLLVLEVREEAREITTSTSRSGANNPKNATVALAVEKVAPSDFRLRPKQALAAGEYGFFYKGSDGQGKIWAFGVD
jgi:hypothetical protein